MSEEAGLSQTSKAGFVALLGRPNVGKSTLLNALLGQKVAAVSHRPQMTRTRQMGILTLDNPPAQIIFIDTPGFHKPRYKLGELMNQEVLETIRETDLVMIVIDSSQPLEEEDHLLFKETIRLDRPAPPIIAMNKVDLLEKADLENHLKDLEQILSRPVIVPVSATRGDNLSILVSSLVDWLPEGPPFFPPDQLTDLYERDITADLIREAALNLLRDEVPHGIAVRIDQFIERNQHGVYIEATIFVEKDSHKPIVIGQGGKMIKALGSHARNEIENITGRKVFLRLNVKVRRNWRNNSGVLQRFGYR